MEEERKVAELKQKEKEETLCKQEEIRRMDQEDLEWIAREVKEREDKARRTAEEELIWHTLQEEEATRAAESPPRDENDEALDYYDDLNQDSEMALSSQGMIPMSSQETAPASSQDTAPMSRQESKATTPASSKESTTQDTNMPSLETATDATILDAADGTNMEDESCLEGPTLKCSLQEERALLNPLLAESLDHLEDMSPGYLTLIEACIHEIWRIRVSQMPVTSPRVPPGLPPLLPKTMPTEPAVTSTLSEAIYSAASNLRTSVPHQTRRTPTCPSDRPS